MTNTLKNGGPVEYLEIPYEPGKVFVLEGRNGRGKSITLDAISAAISGKGTVPVRDGAPRMEMEFGGVTMRVTRNTRRSGKAEVEILEDKFSLADFVEPGLKTADKRDAKRAKVLVALANVKPNESLFYHLVGGEESYRTHIGISGEDCPDLVSLADKIKSKLEESARRRETEAAALKGQAKALREDAKGVDPTEPHDETELTSRMEAAISHRSMIQQRCQSAETAEAARIKAQEIIAKEEAEYDGPTVKEAEKGLVDSKLKLDKAQDEVSRLEDLLQKAVETARERFAEHKECESVMKSAQQHARTVAAAKEALAASEGEKAPSAEEVEESELRVTEARHAIERGAIVRKALKAGERADEILDQAKKTAARAEKLRDAGRDTSTVVTDALMGLGLDISYEGGRLYTTHPKRGKTLVDELSRGELALIGGDIIIKLAEGHENPIFALPQHYREGIDPIYWRQFCEKISKTNICVYSAQCTADEEIEWTSVAVDRDADEGTLEDVTPEEPAETEEGEEAASA
jgi:hypothetical protein